MRGKVAALQWKRGSSVRKRLKFSKVRGRCALTDFTEWRHAKAKSERESDGEICFYACMAPQSCVMNPAQGSPPSAAAEESSPEENKPCDTEELDLSPVRRRKNKPPNLPFSVESLISERTADRRQGCVLSEGSSSPRGFYQSNPETVELGDKDVDHWSHTPCTSPPSEYGSLFLSLHSHRCSSLILVLWSVYCA